MKKGKLIIISGPSGVGKKTIIDQIYPIKSLNLHQSISMTTRQPRVNEIDGKDYFFVSKQEFEEKIKNHEFLEYAIYNNNYYGTPKSFVLKTLEEGNNVLLEIETDGLKKLLNDKINAYKIFIAPPSIDALKQRLLNRNTDSLQVINERIQKAIKELELIHMYDVCIINNDLQKAINDVKQEIQKIINND
ncbi:guanylate kinase [bacterium]|nr:guanylate kinase [bacterium]MBO6022735.1 guanylate kinase [bacterium]MBO6073206.1 guanylate kinase [bacterium]